jgi:ABC-type sulfate/molybdate transport systems ATPase subunit
MRALEVPALKAVGMEAVAGRLPSQLSAASKQRVALASAHGD